MDLVLRAIVAFFFVLLLTRILGRRELSSLEPFDVILLVMIGDLVQQGVTQNDFSVTGMILVGGTIGLLTVEELQAAARKEGLASIEDVRWAVLETSGQISFIPRSSS
jgi:uncharacterized membrane protein YcaP (DUF421 family)